jgi:hypothetical protein
VLDLLAWLPQAEIKPLVQNRDVRFAVLRRVNGLAALLECNKQRLQQLKARGRIGNETRMFRCGSLFSPYVTSPRFCAAQYS